MAALVLHFCIWAVSSCCEGSCSPVSAHRRLIAMASFIVQQQEAPGRAGAVAVTLVLSCPAASGIFLDWDRVHVPCVGRQILNHLTREDPGPHFKDFRQSFLQGFSDVSRALKLLNPGEKQKSGWEPVLEAGSHLSPLDQTFSCWTASSESWHHGQSWGPLEFQQVEWIHQGKWTIAQIA